MDPDRTTAAGPPAAAVAVPPGRSAARRDALLARHLGAERRAALALAWRATWASRLVVWAAGVGAVLAWGNSRRAPGFDLTGVTRPFGDAGNVLAAPAARWDAAWYLDIAHGGYGEAHRAAFFPLYPLLIRAGGAVCGSPLIAGALVSTACFAAALVALHELTALELGGEAARWTVLGLAFSPMSFFFSAVYSESLFLAVSVGAVLAARRGRWWWAGILGGLGAATRSAGIVLLVALVGLALVARPRPRPSDLAPLVLVPAGLAAFVLALAAGGHDALAPFHAQAGWFREWAGPFGGIWDGTVAAWDGARQLLSGQRAHRYFAAAGGEPFAVSRQALMLFAFLAAAVPALVGVARRLPLAYAAYAVAALALPLSYPVRPEPLMSLPRFELVLFPLWMWWGWWLARHPRARWPALTLSAVALAAFTAQFATWHWVA